jgi:hypothetical protein
VRRDQEVDAVERDDVTERLANAVDLDRGGRRLVRETGYRRRELRLTSHRISI